MTFQDVETARKKYLAKYIKSVIFITIFMTVFLAITLPSIIRWDWSSVLGILFYGIAILVFFSLVALNFFLIFYAVTAGKAWGEYQKAYTAYFITRVLERKFTNFTFKPNDGLDWGLLRSFDMLKMGAADCYSSEDLITGKYKNVGFTQSEVTLRINPTARSLFYPRKIFKGRVMIFEFPKKFSFKLELAGKKFHSYHVPGIDKVTKHKMSKIQTESGEFNHAFKIYGEDGVEAFYLLDPAMISKIQQATKQYHGKVLLGFYDNKLLIAIKSKSDPFDPPRANHPIDESAEIQRIAADAKVITDFVDELSLAPIFS